jgi:hypothetical protein
MQTTANAKMFLATLREDFRANKAPPTINATNVMTQVRQNVVQSSAVVPDISAIII